MTIRMKMIVPMTPPAMYKTTNNVCIVLLSEKTTYIWHVANTIRERILRVTKLSTHR